ncbi:TetR family transcriptional regulator C-terminal domain-containing protein [Hydrogenophaga borbori]|uniref:TetR family transcriptional regulator C-terminal domain-containing protein n=1 Tax=Hydrogenophaga TaxID=47420 RepID=UPI00096310CE|nr:MULTISPECIES: TetR family transcriptional regulator C-terminal domain-containing protein [unclassified Hydrogenophaga]MBN9373021.1 TetR family transcriptional regulator C-terminal domain-containing protein [Hydrogenophaga sp.]OJV36430.1 MAG: TetR family transcriptional regulator [Hydrogenophaga sp. 70-12]
MTAAAPPPARRPARESRQRILAAIREAAIQEFSLHGLKGTSTQAIAERAGLTKPQLHYYIAGKEELYAELLDSVMMAWKIPFAPPGMTEPAEILAHYIRLKLDHAFDQPTVSRIFTREILDGGHNLDRYWPKARIWVEEEVAILNGWMARGLMRPMNAHLLLMHIWAMTQHHADFALQVREICGQGPQAPLDREAVANELIPFVLRGCGLLPA